MNLNSANTDVFKRLLSLLVPFKNILFVGLSLALVSSSLGPYRAYLIKDVIDNKLIESNIDQLVVSCLYIIFIILANAFLMYLLTILMQRLGQDVLLNLRDKVFRHIQKLQISYFDQTPVGRLITRVTNDVEALNEIFSAGVVLIVSDVMILTWIVVFMLFTSVKLTLITIVVIPLLLFAASIFRKHVRIAYNQIRIQIANINSFLNEYFTGVSTIQLFNQQETQNAQFDTVNLKHTQLQIQSVHYYAVFFPVVEFLSSSAVALVLWFSAKDILNSELTIGVLVAFIQYAEMMFRPIRDLTEKYNILQSATTASERIFQLLDETEVEKSYSNHPPLQPIENITFKQVSFAYKEDNPVLQNVSFEIKKGETIAIVGATGSGKSTIINLLCKNYTTYDGKILINKQELQSISTVNHRERIAIVLQDLFLFSRSIKDNILLGRSFSDENVEEILELIGADFYKSLPEGINTQILERGNVLSTGQKQFVSFARALIGNPELLILDEATSSIDSETELLIDAATEKLLSGRTSIVIAHRLSTIQKADRIIVLHKGCIIEMGTHHELLQSKGRYHTLHKLQFS